jgi:hypothetical protein
MYIYGAAVAPWTLGCVPARQGARDTIEKPLVVIRSYIYIYIYICAHLLRQRLLLQALQAVLVAPRPRPVRPPRPAVLRVELAPGARGGRGVRERRRAVGSRGRGKGARKR